MTELRTLGNMLHDKILLAVFEYFYVDELFHLFNDVIHHLPLLLKEGRTRLYVRYVNSYFRKRILPNIEVQNVISIYVENMYQMAAVDLQQFTQVRLLTLRNVTVANWPSSFPIQLKYLKIHVRSKERQQVLVLALSVPNLENLELNSSFLHFNDYNYPLSSPSTVKHLAFNSGCSIICYRFLLENVPCLQSFQSTHTFYPHRIWGTESKFSSLNHIQMVCKHIDIEEMISLIIKLAKDTLHSCSLVNVTSRLSTYIAVILLS